MNALYRTVGISKQGFHQQLNSYLLAQDEQFQLVVVISQIRKEHPQLSAREMYFMIQPECMGRDKFEAFCFKNGFKIERKRSFYRTTNSLGVTRFENLVMGRELKGLNQVWVSDITFYRIEDRFYFLTFIMDLYSRRIVGYSASQNLLTEHTTLPALEMAISHRPIKPSLILHSDGGGQYYSKQFLNLTREHKIINSMAENVFENPNAERLNGTLKNDYLIHYNPRNFIALERDLRRAVTNYNQRPHSWHKRLSPVMFEEQCWNMDNSQKTKNHHGRQLAVLRIDHIPDIITAKKIRLKTVNPIQA